MGVHGQEPTKPGVVRLDFVKGTPRRHLLLLHQRPRVRARLHQDLHLLPLSGQGLAERARMGQTSGRRGYRLQRAGQRVRRLRRSRRLQAICDRLGPDDIQAFFDRWTAIIPTPFTDSTGRPGTGGSCRCARSKCRGPSSSTTPAGPEDSSKRSWPTTSASAAPRRSGPWSSPQARHQDLYAIADPGLLAGHRGEDGLHLQAQPRQAIPQGRESAAHRNCHQQTERHRDPGPTPAPARASRAGPTDQRSSAYDRACRPGLCHRLCAVRAHPPALQP